MEGENSGLSGAPMIELTVNTDNFVAILKRMNQVIKDQERRIHLLEQTIESFVKKSEYQSEIKVYKIVSEAQSRSIQALTEKQNALEKNITQSVSKLEETMQSQIYNNFVTLNTSIKTSADQLSSRIDQINTDFGKHLHVTKSIPQQVEDLGKRVQYFHSEYLKGNCGNADVSDELEILVEAKVKECMSKYNNHAKSEPKSPEKRVPESPSASSLYRSASSSLMIDETLYKRVENLNGRIRRAGQDIGRIRNDLDVSNDHIRNIVKAILDEFDVIHNNAKGLEAIPPLNLGNVVPTFFHNPSFSFFGDRSENTEGASDEDFMDDDSRGNRKSLLAQSPKPISACKKVCETPLSPIACDESPIKTPEQEIELVPVSPARSVVLNNTGSIVISDVEGASPKKTPVDWKLVRKLESMYEMCHKEYDDVLSSVDRKVDREFIERLFNKFKTLISSLSERVKELGLMTENCVQKSEIIPIVRKVSAIPEYPDPAAAIRKGGECLFCGHSRSGVAGQVKVSDVLLEGGVDSISQAMSPPNEKNEFVYGEGGAFRRGIPMKDLGDFKLPTLKQHAKTSFNTERNS